MSEPIHSEPVQGEPELIDCPKCGNWQFFREIRLETHSVPFAVTEGEIEWGTAESAAPGIVTEIICGYCSALIHRNGVAAPEVLDASNYKDAAKLFASSRLRRGTSKDSLPEGV